MYRVLIVYGSSEGQTEKITKNIEETLNKNNIEIDVYRKEKPKNLNLEEYDGILVGGSVHMGKHQKHILKFVKQNKDILNLKPTGFYSVSLTAAKDDQKHKRQAQELIDNFIEISGWKPDIAISIAGALKYSKYGIIKKQILKHIAKKEGGDTDTSKDYEYTDWNSVKQFIQKYIETLKTQKLS